VDPALPMATRSASAHSLAYVSSSPKLYERKISSFSFNNCAWQTSLRRHPIRQQRQQYALVLCALGPYQLHDNFLQLVHQQSIHQSWKNNNSNNPPSLLGTQLLLHSGNPSPPRTSSAYHLYAPPNQAHPPQTLPPHYQYEYSIYLPNCDIYNRRSHPLKGLTGFSEIHSLYVTQVYRRRKIHR
jgi:hypothetical protein